MNRQIVLTVILTAGMALACSDSAGPPVVDEIVDESNRSESLVVDGDLRLLGWQPTGGTPRFSTEGTPGIDFASSTADDSPYQVLMSGGASHQEVVAGSSSSATGSKDVLTWSHTVESGLARALVVGVSIRNGGKTVERVTYGGTDLSFVGSQNNHDNAVRVELWYLAAPAVGTAPVQVELLGNAKAVGGATSFTGVDPFAVPTLTSAGSEGTGTTHPTVTVSSALEEVVVAAVATEGDARTMTPEGPGQTERWVLFYGSSGGDVAGAGSTLPGASTVEVRWKTKTVKWAVGAITLRPAPLAHPALEQYEVNFWAVRGEPRYVQINYATGSSTAKLSEYPFLRLDVQAPTLRPDGSEIAVGDSVLITVVVDSTAMVVQLLPHGLQFDPADGATLQMWYTGVNGDFNDDGVVDEADEYIEQQLLGMWYQEQPGMPWMLLDAEQSVEEDWFWTTLEHFSGFAVAY